MQDFKLTRSKLALFSIPVVLALIFPIIVWPLATWETISPQGSGFLELVIPFLFIAALLLIGGVFLFSAVCCVFTSCRPGAFIALLICLASAVFFLSGCFVGGRISNHVRTNALIQLAERSQPLIAAIKSYERKYGNPPDALAALVPEFILVVPHTGIGATPDYKYHSFTNGATYGNNTWTLEVYHAAGPPLFDTFIYLPLQDYSVLPHQYEGQIRKIRDWAYWYQG